VFLLPKERWALIRSDRSIAVAVRTTKVALGIHAATGGDTMPRNAK
jgi:hypothetical protein